jgi:hypothetical protein
MTTCSREILDVTYLVVRLDDMVRVEEDPDEVEVVVGADEVELLKEELEESVELELLQKRFLVTCGNPGEMIVRYLTSHLRTIAKCNKKILARKYLRSRET